MIKRANSNSVSPLWKKYKRTKDIKIRNKLIEKYLGFVKYNALKIKEKMPDYIELDDLVSAGIFGLINAIESFDFSRGVVFEVYSFNRIRGAMLDEIRSMDWVPRTVRLYANKYRKVVEELSGQNGYGYLPTSQEVADYFGISIQEAEKIRIESTAPVIRFYRIVGDESSDTSSQYDSIPDFRVPRPEDEISKEDDFNKLICLILTEREQFLITLYYKNYHTLLEISRILNLCYTSILKIHSDALKKIEKFLKFKKHPYAQYSL